MARLLGRFCARFETATVMVSLPERLLSLAQEEVRRTLAALPKELRGPARAIPLSFDTRSVDELDGEGVGDTLGLFVGENLLEAGQGSGGLPAQIILYLANIWWEAEEDEA